MAIRRRALRAISAILSAIILICPFVCAADESGRPNVEIIFDFLINDMELNSAAACGVLANIEKESAFRHDVYGDGGTSYGICQWHDFSEGEGRFTNLKNYCDANGLDWQSVNGQLKFLYYELSSSPWYSRTLNYLRSVPNTEQGAYDAALYWCYYFEIPAQKDVQAALRGENARDKYWPVYGDGSASAERGFEIWKVGSSRLNVRSGPDTSYFVVETLDPGTEVRVTEITATGTTYWAKGATGWSVLEGLDYVSGELCTVTFVTGCAYYVPAQRLRWGATFTLPSTSSMAKYGYAASGWKVGSETKSAGATLTATKSVSAEVVWKRDSSVSLLRGDANCDGKVNAKDVTAIMKNLVGSGSFVASACADVNSDVKLNAKDVTVLMKYIVGTVTLAERLSASEEAAWK